MQAEKTLYEKVYIAGISTDIWTKIKEETRRKISRNTVHLALKDEAPSTPLRARIQEIAVNLLREIEEPQLAEA